MDEKYCCGPDYLPDWLRKYLSKKFDIACLWHDYHYETKEKSRRESDDYFLEQMISLSKTRWDRIIAYTFYYICRLFGWSRYGKPD